MTDQSIPIDMVVAPHALPAILIGFPTGTAGSSTGDPSSIHVLATDAALVDLHAVGVNTRVMAADTSAYDAVCQQRADERFARRNGAGPGQESLW